MPLCWPVLAKFNLNCRHNFEPHLNFIFDMKIKSMFIFQIDIRNQIYLYFYLHIPSRHTTSFQRRFNVHMSSSTSYRRLIDVGTTCVYWVVFHLLFQEYHILGCSTCLVMLLIRFNLIKILLFWNGNSKSSGSNGPSWPIPVIVFCRTNTNGNPSSAFAI